MRNLATSPVASCLKFGQKDWTGLDFKTLWPTEAIDIAEIVRWVSESLRPFSTIEDRGFKSLMKTGRHEYYLPSHSTVSRDVRLVFAHTCNCIAKMLQVSSDAYC